MTRARKSVIIASALIAVLLVIVILAGPYLLKSFFYPKPHGLPPAVAQTADQLLSRLQAALDTNAPVVARSLQPGLSAAQISQLEAQGGFHLSEDLRAFYCWHNGMATNSAVGLLPGQHFVPLEEVVLNQTGLSQQVASGSSAQRAAFKVLAGHRKSWVQILDDGAGDGYFYDPDRKDAEGAFFYHFTEVGYYVWFPSFRNFLAGVSECYESRAVTVATNGNSLDEDSARTQKIWERLAKSNQPDQ